MTDWTVVSGGALTVGAGTLAYSYNSSVGNGWNQSVNSSSFSSLGYVDDFEFSFQVDNADVRYLMMGIN